MGLLTSRAYYKARVLLVPLGNSGHELVDAMAKSGLREVAVAEQAEHSDGILVRDINEPETSFTTETLSERISNTDMLVFLGSNLEEIADEVVRSYTQVGSHLGTLMAGVLVDARGWDSPSGSDSIKELRRGLDMLITLRQLGLAQDFIEVLKGGAAEASPGRLFQYS